MPTLGEIIHQRRQVMNLRQQKLADILNDQFPDEKLRYSNEWISKLEHDKHSRLDDTKLRNLATVLELDVTDLIDARNKTTHADRRTRSETLLEMRTIRYLLKGLDLPGMLIYGNAAQHLITERAVVNDMEIVTVLTQPYEVVLITTSAVATSCQQQIDELRHILKELV